MMSLAQPGWLALLILIPLLGCGALLAARLKNRRWQAFVAPRLRGALLKTGSAVPRWLALLFLLAACTAMIAALARPQGKTSTQTETTTGRNILIALDLSRSMRVRDVQPDRLAQAKLVIYEMLDAMPNDRVGLLGFAGSAYLYAPLTIDHAALRETVEQIDETWAPLGGSDLAAAVALATTTLKETGQKNNALVILSDGEETTGKENIGTMVGDAEKSGVSIFSIGVGTENGGFVPDPNFPDGRMVDESGDQVLSRLQPDVMRRLATETGGRYAVAGSGMDIPAMVTAAAAALDAFETAGRQRKVSVEFYQWLLLPAIVLLMGSIIAGTRWKGMRAAAAALGAFVFLPPQARADEALKAREALATGQFGEARDAYGKLAEKTEAIDRQARFRLGQGTAAYRGGDYRAARTAFSQSLLGREPEVLSNAHLGLANTLFQLGWQGLADEAYPSAPEPPPDLERFDTIVRERLAKMLEAEGGEDGRSEGFVRMESVVLNWADAVRHYDSASAANPSDPAAPANKKMAVTYLKRLRELLEQEKNQAEEAMGQPQPGQGPPQEGKGQPGEKGEGGEPGEQGEGGEEPNDQGDGGDEERDGKSGGEGDEKEKGKKGAADPNESPEDRARRLLNENADLEKGPLSPGRREFREPEKDW